MTEPQHALGASIIVRSAGADVFSGTSVTRVSVVMIVVAIDEAFSSAEHVTFSGSPDSHFLTE